MTRYAVFLRAVNVGASNRIAMDDLRRRVTDLGFTDVATHLATGNLMVTDPADRDAEAVAAAVEAGLAAGGLVKVDAMVWHPEELRALVAVDRFPDHVGEDWRRCVSFLRRPPARDGTDRVTAKGLTVVHADDRVILSAYPSEWKAFPLGIEAAWKVSATTRWWSVVREFTDRYLGDA